MKNKLFSGLAAILLLLTAIPTAVSAREAELPPLISPNPLISPAPNEELADLPQDHWAREAALRMVEKNAISPLENGVFAPDAPFTREMLVTALWHFSGCPVVNAILTFQDVAPDSQSAEAIRWAAAEGIVSGFSAQIFRPQQPVTREQMAKIIYGYVQKYGMGFNGAWMFLLPYEDAGRIAQWAFEPMHWMVANRIIQGVTDTLLLPGGTVTRAQGAVMLSRLLDTTATAEADFLQYGVRGG